MFQYYLKIDIKIFHLDNILSTGLYFPNQLIGQSDNIDMVQDTNIYVIDTDTK